MGVKEEQLMTLLVDGALQRFLNHQALLRLC